LRYGYTRLRAAAFAAFLSVLVVTTGAPAPVAASTGADSVFALAKAQLGDPWVHGAIGPRAFDCSGLVYYVFRQTGNLSRIGNRRMSGYGYLSYFRARGLTSRTSGRPGDLVVWGGGSHIGIYLGNGKAISTLTSGVRIHGVYAVTARFTAFLHTGFSTSAPTPPVAPPVAPPVTPPVTPPATPPTDPASQEPSVPAIRAITSSVRRTTGNLNLRRRPGVGWRILRVLPKGTMLTVLRSGHDVRGRVWYKVQIASGITGWVASWYTRPYVR
jgi:NlpC/P60 family protein/SH3 domain-containing protein